MYPQKIAAAARQSRSALDPDWGTIEKMIAATPISA